MPALNPYDNLPDDHPEKQMKALTERRSECLDIRLRDHRGLDPDFIDLPFDHSSWVPHTSAPKTDTINMKKVQKNINEITTAFQRLGDAAHEVVIQMEKSFDQAVKGINAAFPRVEITEYTQQLMGKSVELTDEQWQRLEEGIAAIKHRHINCSCVYEPPQLSDEQIEQIKDHIADLRVGPFYIVDPLKHMSEEKRQEALELIRRYNFQGILIESETDVSSEEDTIQNRFEPQSKGLICRECKYYAGFSFQDYEHVSCGVHPYGPKNGECPDFESKV